MENRHDLKHKIMRFHRLVTFVVHRPSPLSTDAHAPPLASHAPHRVHSPVTHAGRSSASRVATLSSRVTNQARPKTKRPHLPIQPAQVVPPAQPSHKTPLHQSTTTPLSLRLPSSSAPPRSPPLLQPPAAAAASFRPLSLPPLRPTPPPLRELGFRRRAPGHEQQLPPRRI